MHPRRQPVHEHLHARIQVHLRRRFPVKTLEDSRFDEAPIIPATQIRILAEGGYLSRAYRSFWSAMQAPAKPIWSPVWRWKRAVSASECASRPRQTRSKWRNGLLFRTVPLCRCSPDRLAGSHVLMCHFSCTCARAANLRTSLRTDTRQTSILWYFADQLRRRWELRSVPASAERLDQSSAGRHLLNSKIDRSFLIG